MDAKLEVARVGTGIVNPGEYDKNGDPLPPNGPPTSASRSRSCGAGDLLRQLVPVISPAADGMGESSKPEGWHSPEAMIASAATVHDPHPNRLPIPDDYSIEDANADFFD